MIFDQLRKIQSKKLNHASVERVFLLISEGDGALSVGEISDRLKITQTEVSTAIARLLAIEVIRLDRRERQRKYYKADRTALEIKEAGLKQFLEPVNQ